WRGRRQLTVARARGQGLGRRGRRWWTAGQGSAHEDAAALVDLDADGLADREARGRRSRDPQRGRGSVDGHLVVHRVTEVARAGDRAREDVARRGAGAGGRGAGPGRRARGGGGGAGRGAPPPPPRGGRAPPPAPPRGPPPARP